MATYRVLGQSNPVAAQNADLYTVPASKAAILSTLTVANRSPSATTFRVAIRPNGASILNEHYIAYDVTIAGNSLITMTLGLTLAESDVVTVYAGAASLSFGAFGSEVAA